jgi:uncharacterized protein YukE
VGEFTQQSVDNNGGVAWAKQVAAAMDPGAVGDQIVGYQQAADSLSNVASTLQRIKANLAATWEGDAAEQAQMSFQSTIDHAQLVHETIAEEIIRPLRTAESAQQTYIAAMRNVPDEKPVPSTNMLESGYDYFTGQATPTQQARAHNIQARYKSALALNALSMSQQYPQPPGSQPPSYPSDTASVDASVRPSSRDCLSRRGHAGLWKPRTASSEPRKRAVKSLANLDAYGHGWLSLAGHWGFDHTIV